VLSIIFPGHQENFGIGAMEVLAHATPLIPSTQTDSRQEADHSKMGLVATAATSGTAALLSYAQRLSIERYSEDWLNAHFQEFLSEIRLIAFLNNFDMRFTHLYGN
jgi:glycosyltransferase involved in cell wall biosynthesis